MSTVICGLTTQISRRPTTTGYHKILKRWGGYQYYQRIKQRQCHMDPITSGGGEKHNQVSNSTATGMPNTTNDVQQINKGFFKVSDFVNALEKDPNWKKMQKIYESEIKKNVQNIKGNKNISGDLKQRKFTTSALKWNYHRMFHTTNMLKETQRNQNKLIYSNVTQSNCWTNTYQIWRIMNQTPQKNDYQYKENKKDYNIKYLKNFSTKKYPSSIMKKQLITNTTQSIQNTTRLIRRNFRNNINRRILLRKLRRLEFFVRIFIKRIDRMLERIEEPRKASLLKLLDIFVNNLVLIKTKIWQTYDAVQIVYKFLANVIIKMNEWRKRHLITDKLYKNQMVISTGRLIKRYLIQNQFYRQQIQYYSKLPERFVRRTVAKTKHVLTTPKYIIKSTDGTTKNMTKIISNSLHLSKNADSMYNFSKKDNIENIFKELNRGRKQIKRSSSPERIRFNIDNIIKKLNIVTPPFQQQKTKWKSSTVKCQDDVSFERAILFKFNKRGESKKQVVKRKVGLINMLGEKSNVNRQLNQTLSIKKLDIFDNGVKADNSILYKPLKEFKVGSRELDSESLTNDILESKILSSNSISSQTMSTDSTDFPKNPCVVKKSPSQSQSIPDFNVEKSHSQVNVTSTTSDLYKELDTITKNKKEPSIPKPHNSESSKKPQVLNSTINLQKESKSTKSQSHIEPTETGTKSKTVKINSRKESHFKDSPKKMSDSYTESSYSWFLPPKSNTKSSNLKSPKQDNILASSDLQKESSSYIATPTENVLNSSNNNSQKTSYPGVSTSSSHYNQLKPVKSESSVTSTSDSQKGGIPRMESSSDLRKESNVVSSPNSHLYKNLNLKSTNNDLNIPKSATTESSSDFHVSKPANSDLHKDSDILKCTSTEPCVACDSVLKSCSIEPCVACDPVLKSCSTEPCVACNPVLKSENSDLPQSFTTEPCVVTANNDLSKNTNTSIESCVEFSSDLKKESNILKDSTTEPRATFSSVFKLTNSDSYMDSNNSQSFKTEPSANSANNYTPKDLNTLKTATIESRVESSSDLQKLTKNDSHKNLEILKSFQTESRIESANSDSRKDSNTFKSATTEPCVESCSDLQKESNSDLHKDSNPLNSDTTKSRLESNSDLGKEYIINSDSSKNSENLKSSRIKSCESNSVLKSDISHSLKDSNSLNSGTIKSRIESNSDLEKESNISSDTSKNSDILKTSINKSNCVLKSANADSLNSFPTKSRIESNSDLQKESNSNSDSSKNSDNLKSFTNKSSVVESSSLLKSANSDSHKDSNPLNSRTTIELNSDLQKESNSTNDSSKNSDNLKSSANKSRVLESSSILKLSSSDDSCKDSNSLKSPTTESHIVSNSDLRKDSRMNSNSCKYSDVLKSTDKPCVESNSDLSSPTFNSDSNILKSPKYDFQSTKSIEEKEATSSNSESMKMLNKNLLNKEPIAVLKTVHMGEDFKDIKNNKSNEIDEIRNTNLESKSSEQSEERIDEIDEIRDIRLSVLNRINSLTKSVRSKISSTLSLNDQDTSNAEIFKSIKTFKCPEISSSLCEAKDQVTDDSVNNFNQRLDKKVPLKYCTCKKNKNGLNPIFNEEAEREILSATNAFFVLSDSEKQKQYQTKKKEPKKVRFSDEFTVQSDRKKKQEKTKIKTNIMDSKITQKDKSNDESIVNLIKSSESIVNQAVKLTESIMITLKDSEAKNSEIKNNEQIVKKKMMPIIPQSVANSKENNNQVGSKNGLEKEGIRFNNDDHWDIEIRRIQLSDLNRIKPSELDNYVCTVIMPQEIKSIEQLSNIISPLSNIKQINEHHYSAVIGKETKIKTNKSDIQLSTVCNKNTTTNQNTIHDDIHVNIKINDENILKSATMALNNNNNNKNNMTLLSRQCNIQESQRTRKHLENVKIPGKELEIQYLCERCKDSIHYLNTLSRISTDALTILERDKLNQILGSISKKCNVIITKFDSKSRKLPPVTHYDTVNIYQEPTVSLRASDYDMAIDSDVVPNKSFDYDGEILNKTEYKNVDLVIFEDNNKLPTSASLNVEDHVEEDENGVMTSSNGRHLVEYKNVDLVVTKYNVKGTKTKQHIMTIDVHQKPSETKSQTNNEDSDDEPRFRFKDKSVSNRYPSKSSTKPTDPLAKHQKKSNTTTHTLSNVFEKSIMDENGDHSRKTEPHMKSIQMDKAFLPPIGVKESSNSSSSGKRHWKPKKCCKDTHQPSFFGFFDDIIKGVANKLKKNQDSDSSSSKYNKFSQTANCLFDNSPNVETVTLEPVLVDVNPGIKIVSSITRDRHIEILEPAQVSNDLVEIKINPNNYLYDVLFIFISKYRSSFAQLFRREGRDMI